MSRIIVIAVSSLAVLLVLGYIGSEINLAPLGEFTKPLSTLERR